MYSVEKIENQYLLCDDSTNSSVKIAPQKGGILTSYITNGREVIYRDADFFEEKEERPRGGIPILFPACGRLTDKAYMLDGKRYEMSMHGFARDLEWQVVDIKNDAFAEVTLLLTHSAETLKIYPFEFTFKITYRLKSGALTVTQQVTNNSDMPMPYSIGLHPYFRADKSKASIRVPSSVAYSGSERLEIDGVLKSDTDIDYVCINPTGESSILNTGLGYNVELSYQGEYNCIVVWSPTFNPNFICVEPWSAAPDALNTKENLIYLKPGESQRFVMKLSVSE